MTTPENVTITVHEDQIQSDLPPQDSAGSGEFTLVRDENKSAAFTEWIEQTSDTDQGTVTLAVVDAQNNLVRRIHLSNAWASRWEGPQLGAANGGPATEQVTITYEDITVE
ncbi:phage tail protein [Nocardia tengchongensis]|uniref:phage tail protein n=1 Tax=Nocardia tengchongensis TaxID=2055889 RepID=UPI003647D093